MAEGAALRSQVDVGVTRILEEGGEAQGIHATGDDGGELDHALPLLVVVRAISLIPLEHACAALVIGTPSILPKLMVLTWMPLATMTREIFVCTKAVQPL